MENKIFIDNPLLRFSRKGTTKETQLVADSVIRFEVDGNKFTVQINADKDGILIRKVDGVKGFTDIILRPGSANSVEAK
jgi:hypothetical protein